MPLVCTIFVRLSRAASREEASRLRSVPTMRMMSEENKSAFFSFDTTGACDRGCNERMRQWVGERICQKVYHRVDGRVCQRVGERLYQRMCGEPITSSRATSLVNARATMGRTVLDLLPL